MPATRKNARAPAPVQFPRRGTPPDATGYPHYGAIEKNNARWRAEYLRELKRRRAERQALLERKAGGRRAQRARAARRFAHVRHALAENLGLKLAAAAPKAAAKVPAFRFATYGAGATGLKGPFRHADVLTLWLRVPGGAWAEASEGDGELELLLLLPRGRAPKGGRALALVLPDCGPWLAGGEDPAATARGLGYALALRGAVVAIPKLPAYERFSVTLNKQRIAEGSCALGALLHEAAGALSALLAHQPRQAGRAWVAGRGLGGTLALMLGALDGRAAGVLAEAPVRIGSGEDPEALYVPRFNRTTDLPELAASIAPRPLALVAGPKQKDLLAGPPCDVRTLARAAKAAFALHGASSELKVFAARRQNAAADWIVAPKRAQGQKGPRGVLARGEKPQRVYAIAKMKSAAAWKRARAKLMAAYRDAGGIPARNKPLGVTQVGAARLRDCTRLEYHVRTGRFTYANVTFLRPPGPVSPRTTILCLPGSGSDVARVEDQYAHEVVAQGWNAAIVDARVALYPFHPDIPESGNLINQSVHDLLCALDYVAKRKDVDATRIGAMGVSQGGTHSWMLAMLDERVAAAAPVCGICTWRSLPKPQGLDAGGRPLRTALDSHSFYYYTPGVLRYADQQDLIALIAPRPLCFIGADKDYCFPLDGMRECDRDLRRLYRMLGAGKHYEYVEFAGPHSMPPHTRRKAYAFFRKVLRDPDTGNR